MTFIVYITEDSNKTYSAYVANLPGCFSYGRTLKEAEKNVKEAIQCHLASLRKDGLLKEAKLSPRREYWTKVSV